MKQELERMLLLKGRERLPNILIAAAECAPLSKTGGLADVAGALPRALAQLGIDARVITPYHRCIKEKYADRVEHITEIYVDLGWRHQYAGLEKLELPGLTVYLVDSEYYFGDRIYRGGEPEVEQYAFFQRAVLELIPKLPGFLPEVLHCNDWHTAMLPFLIKTQYRGRPQGALKTILTIHNIAFQGWVSCDRACDMLNIDWRWCGVDGIRHYDCANFLKTGCCFADRVNTVSPSYAREICTPEFGANLQEVLIGRGSDLSGILNGIDTVAFDPASDPSIPVHYDADSVEGKQANKRALLEELGLWAVGETTPLIGMVSRMTAQKGFDLVLEGMDELMQRDVGFVLLGTGDAYYEGAFRALEQRFPGRVCAYIGYREDLSRRIYAGADFFLMPSAFEPCGLSQMIAMRYGALPIVHEVGGLRDTVRPYDWSTGAGNGFSFYDFDCGTMLSVIDYALSVYADAETMGALVRSAMTTDFSFGPSAGEYAKLYLSVLDAQDGVAHDPMREEYRLPFEALRCGERLRLRLKAAAADSATAVVNGAEIPMEREADGFFSVSVTAPEQRGWLSYFFRLGPDVRLGESGLGCGEVRPWLVTVYDRSFRTPDWAEGTVMYQIFPDRFARVGGAFAEGVRYHRAAGRRIETHEDWLEPMKHLPGAGEQNYTPNDFYGGTLEGIRARLPELRAMGVRCLYLNPIFESDSNHRYNTGDYRRIDPMLGTEEEFSALCGEARRQGIRVILDGVFSHTGDDSRYFNRYGRYPGPGAYQGPDSPYFSWYAFRHYPEDYRCWWNFRSLPEVDERDPDWQDFVIAGEDSVMRHWLRRGASGWRLDVADELPDEAIDRMRENVKAEDAGALLLGEVWEDATTKVSYGVRRQYALGRGLDSVMNYPFRVAMLDFALWRTDAAGLRDFLAGQKQRYPGPMYRCLMNLLGSHDTARLRSVLGSGGVDGSGMSREEQAAFALSPEQNARGEALQRLCAAVQFAIPGMPCVYYGDEEGMEGLTDPFCRATYRRQNDALREYYRYLAQCRNGSAALSRGDAAFASCGADTVCVLRWTAGELCLLAVNRAPEPCAFRPADLDFLGAAAELAVDLEHLPELSVPAMDSVLIQKERG